MAGRATGLIAGRIDKMPALSADLLLSGAGRRWRRRAAARVELPDRDVEGHPYLGGYPEGQGTISAGGQDSRR